MSKGVDKSGQSCRPLMRKSDYPKVLRRVVAVIPLLLLLFGAFAPVAMALVANFTYKLPAWWKGGEERER